MAKLDRIRRISSEEKLLEIALQHPDIDNRYVAVECISDQAKLKKIFQDVTNLEIRMLTISKISDTNFLSQVALDSSIDPFVRVVALRLLDDTNVSSQLLFDESSEVRREAVKSVNDIGLLLKIVHDSPDHVLRKRATEKIDSERALFDIFLNDPSPLVQQTALGRIQSAEILGEIQRVLNKEYTHHADPIHSIDISAD